MVRNVKGFTMVELMIVIAIIGILAVTLVPAFTGMQARARDTGRVQTLESASTALEAWKSDTNAATFPQYAVGAAATAWADKCLAAYAKADRFSSLTASKMQDATQVSVFTTAAPGTDVCTLSRSYGYSQAQASAAGDTYLLYARLETPSKGNVVLAAAAPGTAFTSASLKGTVLQGQGNQTIVIGGTTYWFYGVHGGNKQ